MDILKLKVASVNCRGLNTENKLMQLRDYLNLYQIDICLVQETHLNSKENLDKLSLFCEKYKIVCPLSETKSRGVGILVKEALVNDETLEFRFFENRTLSLDLKIDQNIISIVNIYAPNLRVEQVKFIEELHSFLYDKKNIIFGGDFNNCFGLDSDTGLEKKWNDLNKLFCLEEANKSQKNEKQFIYTWTNGHSTSRIDRLYLRNKEKKLSLNYSECISNSNSDHKIVICELSILKSIKIRKI